MGKRTGRVCRQGKSEYRYGYLSGKGGVLLLHSHELSQQQQTDKTFPALNMPWEGKNLNYIIISEHTAGQLGIDPYVYSVSFNVGRWEEPEIKAKLQDILAGFNREAERYTAYYLVAKSDILAEEQSYILAVRGVMGFFNGALLLFAVLGYGNMVLAGLLERQREFVILRCIGMTGKQLRRMLIWEGIFYSCCIKGLLLSLGNVILMMTGMIMRRNTSYFVYLFRRLNFCVILFCSWGLALGARLLYMAVEDVNCA